jgi:hypothetical protein
MLSFAGTWKIDAGASTVWDPRSQAYVPDEVGEEIITIRIDGDVQEYEVLYGGGPTIRMGYTSRYDDPEWVTYEVREILGLSAGEASLEAFRQRVKATDSFAPGTDYGLVRTVYVDERTHYRLCKDSTTGEARYCMLRRLSEDGNSYFATVLRADGIINRTRHFVRTA